MRDRVARSGLQPAVTRMLSRQPYPECEIGRLDRIDFEGGWAASVACQPLRLDLYEAIDLNGDALPEEAE